MMTRSLWLPVHTRARNRATVLRLSAFCLRQPGLTFTHSHLLFSSIVPNLLHQSNMIHGVLPVQFTHLTVFFHNLCPSFLCSTSWPGTLHFLLHTFLHPIIVFFSQHTHTITTCFAEVLRLCLLIPISLSTLYLELYLLYSLPLTINDISLLVSNGTNCLNLFHPI